MCLSFVDLKYYKKVIKIKDISDTNWKVLKTGKSLKNLFYYHICAGQEAVKTYLTPEGVPTDSPKNITTRFQTPDVIEISYDAPPEESQNGQVGSSLLNCFQ